MSPEMAYSGDEHHPGWRDCPAAINFDLVMATALINFGALVASPSLTCRSSRSSGSVRSVTNAERSLPVSVPADVWCADRWALWVNLEESSMVLGLIWAAMV